MNRTEKIALLKGVKDGTRSITELMPHVVEYFNLDKGHYTNTLTGDKFTTKQFMTRTRPLASTYHEVVFKSMAGLE